MNEKRFDPDTASAPLVGFAEDYELLASSVHSHRRGQLYYCVAGTLKVRTEEGLWVVTPRRALWLPGGVQHRSTSHYAVSFRSLYIDQHYYPQLPLEPRAMQVSNLLRELIQQAIDNGVTWREQGESARLAGVVVDQILQSNTVCAHLPMPKDNRALTVCRQMRDKPNLHTDVTELCRSAGVSQRTLVRLLQQETGMSLQQWRQQLLLLSAIELMAQGMPVTTVATDLGYATPSAFTYMFRQMTGTAPTSYC